MMNLKSVHRLDRQTSGVVFFAKNDVMSNTFRKALINDEVSKAYFARIQGNFKDKFGSETQVTKAIYTLNLLEGKYSC
jgi:23S rRNA-/tRNA-specific pseudouridylate synthase